MFNKKTNYSVAVALLFGVLSSMAHAAPTTQPTQPPNIVLILADDLGYSDLGSYGSEIDTPNLDGIAAQGMRFANFHTAASCAPTRAMLLTGVDSHVAGVANIIEAIPDYQATSPAYQGALDKNVATISERLRNQGYRTYMSGKWHLGQNPEQLPSKRGFDRAFSLGDTGADNWRQRTYLPIYENANWYEDGLPTALLEDFYSSKTLVDKAIDYIDSATDEDTTKPFFTYLAFQAVHIPVQAPAEFRDKYLQTYADGWSVLREQRSQGLVDKGILATSVPSYVAPTTVPWDSLDAQTQAFESKGMAVYAGMVDAMDHHIGRLVAHLQRLGKLDNTVFIFLSDNGAEGSLATRQLGDNPAAPALIMNAWMRASGFSTDIETLGEIDSYHDIGPSWASAAVGPLAWYKFFASEGGMRVPLVIGGKVNGQPVIANTGAVSQSLAWITDIAPTILQLAGAVDLPSDMSGKSLMPVLQDERASVRLADEIIGYELGGNKALFQGDYKLVYNRFRGQEPQWQLFNISADPGETQNLASAKPQLFIELKAAYALWAEQNGVVEVRPDYDQGQVMLGKVFANRPILLVYLGGGLLAVLTLFVIIPWLLVRRFRKRI
ncbi:arylsulfatase [Pseudomonadales bacterium]|nr:arylsulfatase [Pseudomonadales bacterium]